MQQCVMLHFMAPLSSLFPFLSSLFSLLSTWHGGGYCVSNWIYIYIYIQDFEGSLRVALNLGPRWAQITSGTCDLTGSLRTSERGREVRSDRFLMDVGRPWLSWDRKKGAPTRSFRRKTGAVCTAPRRNAQIQPGVAPVSAKIMDYCFFEACQTQN